MQSTSYNMESIHEQNQRESQAANSQYQTFSQFGPQAHIANWMSPVPNTGSFPSKPKLEDAFEYAIPEVFNGIGGSWPVNSFSYMEDSVIPIVHHSLDASLADDYSSEYSSSRPQSTQFLGEDYLHPQYSYPQPLLDCDGSSLITNMTRRLSDASTSLSTNDGPVSEAYYGEFRERITSTPFSESMMPSMSHAPSVASTRNASPAMSPRSNMGSRPISYGKASPSPRMSLRVSPYSQEGRNKRWSTGSMAPTPVQENIMGFVPLLNQGLTQTWQFQDSDVAHNFHGHSQGSCHGTPEMTVAELPMYGNPANQYNVGYQYSDSLMPPKACLESQTDISHSEAHMPFFRMLHSNVHTQHRYADLSDPPDLYGSLADEQIMPPAGDMNPEDPDMKPHEQELRFEGDLYTPRWVRNHGNKREGWCGVCKPGRWLVLKNSAFWYDKSFSHGISAATGQAFMEPREIRRMDGNPDVWEGLCHSCNDWVSLVSNKKKGTTWFRHAYKCHNHQKCKSVEKRRRESSHSKAISQKLLE